MPMSSSSTPPNDPDIDNLPFDIPLAASLPDIRALRDTNNIFIPNAGSSYTDVVYLSGMREIKTAVEIRDNSRVIATIATRDQVGWASPPLPVAVGRHIFTVRVPGSAQESAAWIIDVMPMRPVTIDSLIDGNNASIANGGTTTSDTATLHGTATPGQSLYILLNGDVQQQVPVNAAGRWTCTISPLFVYVHRFVAVSASSGESNTWQLEVRSEWTNINTLFQDNSYDGWLLHNAARCGSIRGWIDRPMFCNFTDFGPQTGFAGTIFYRDLIFLPGTYQFGVRATHIAEGGPNPKLVNPIFSLTEDAQFQQVDRALPKDGQFYDLILTLTVTARKRIRLYINNRQDGSNGNDYVIERIWVLLMSGGGDLMSVPPQYNELPPYEGPLRQIDMPMWKEE